MTSHTPSLVQQYQAIADITNRMVDEARQQQWPTVLELSKRYIDAVEQLKLMQDLSHSDRLARRNLLSRIIENDAEVRQLAMPELDRLGHLLGDMRRQKKVVTAYCSPTYSA